MVLNWDFKILQHALMWSTVPKQSDSVGCFIFYSIHPKYTHTHTHTHTLECVYSFIHFCKFVFFCLFKN